MTFGWLPTWAVVAGLAGLAGLLFALQRLRVRHRTVVVPTTIFWREALEEARARVLVQRFRHPWTYVLLLAIASLLWLAIAGPRADESRGVERVLVIDASAHAEGPRFAAWVAAAEERAARLPRATTRVLAAGADVRTLLAPGEDLPLLARRAARLSPEPCPSSLDRALTSLARVAPPPAGRVVEVFGDAPIDPELARELSGRLDVRRARLADEASRPNAGVVALGVSESASGAWGAVDVFARVRGADGARVTIDGRDVPVTWTRAPGDATVTATLRDVPADGARLAVSTAGDDARASDDVAARVLPRRAPLRVAVSEDVPVALRAALARDPGLALGADPTDAELVVRRSGATFGGDRPALEVTDDETQAAFRVAAPGAGDDARALEGVVATLGLDEVDATGLATAAGRPVTLELAEAPLRTVRLWSRLATPEFDFLATRAGPLVLARVVRWLGDVPALAPETAAGRGGDRPLAWIEPDGRLVVAPAGASYPAAGTWRDPRAGDVSVALLDDDATSGRRDVEALAEPARAAGLWTRDPMTWLVLAALALLCLEGWWFRKERIA